MRPRRVRSLLTMAARASLSLRAPTSWKRIQLAADRFADELQALARGRLERAARHLQLPRSDYFGYGYANTLAQGDLSNHQFALLALELLDRHELGPNRRQWQRLAEFLLRHQHPEGGWGYFPQQSSSLTMLWAGAACLAACLAP